MLLVIRSFTILALFVGLFGVVFAVGAVPAGAAQTEVTTPLAGGSVLNIGHRGTAGLAPEHTTASYDLALKLGADYIEQDLRMTKDGVLVILHDEDLDRTTRGPAENCTGPVSEKTLAQIKTCDVGSFFNERYPEYARDEYAGLKVLTLEEVFQRYGTQTNYYIETRSSEAPPGNPGIDDSSGMEEELLRLMDEYGLRGLAAENWRVLIQSFVSASLAEIHAQDPSLPLVQLYSDEETSETIQANIEAAQAYAIGVGPSQDDVDPGLVEAAHTRCMAIHPYTLEEKTDMQDLVDLGVDGMFTNFPDRLDEVLGEGAVDNNLAAQRAAEAYRTCQSGIKPTMPETGGITPLIPASLGVLLLGLGLSLGAMAMLRRVLQTSR